MIKIKDKVICINAGDSIFLQEGMIYNVVNVENEHVTVHKDNSYIGCYPINYFEKNDSDV